MTNRIIYTKESIDISFSQEVVEKLVTLDAENSDDITMVINCRGGCCSSTFAIYDAMLNISSDIKTIGIGRVESCAIILIAAGTKGKRLSTPNTTFMIHQLRQSNISGTTIDVGVAQQELNRLNQVYLQTMAREINKPLSQIEQDTQRDRWMSASDAQKYGIIDKIVTKGVFVT